MRQIVNAIAIVLATAGSAIAQAPRGSARESISANAARLLNAGRGNEARILLQRAALDASSRELRAVYRLHVGDSYVHDGQYEQAARTYGSVLSGTDAEGIDSLTSWAHRGLGMTEAFLGRRAPAAVHLKQALDAHANPRRAQRDSIEMLMLSGQHEAASKAIDRLAAANDGGATERDVALLRSLNIVLSGHCTAALEELTKGRALEGPLSQAIRGRCASKRGQRMDARALRDSVLTQPMSDPFDWDMLIARDVARKIPWR